MDGLNSFVKSGTPFTKAALLVFIFAVGYLSLFGRDGRENAEAKGKSAIVAVQNANSLFEHSTILNYMQNLVTVSMSTGNKIDIEGWSFRRSGEAFDVFFTFNENGEKKIFHWMLKPDGRLQGVDELSRQVSKDQPVDVSGIF